MANQLTKAMFWGLHSFAGSLPQTRTSGASHLGSLDFSPLPQFLSDHPQQHGFPWGEIGVAESCPTNVPDTGVTRYYDWTVARSTLAPDGVEVDVMFVNGEFPGPLIEANWGDWVEVNVWNGIEGPEEGLAMHWHGINQLGTPWADGIPTVGQCPIVPGGNLTYRWQANQYGTSWWHSHYSSQYSNGVQGAIVVHGPPSADYDIDLGPVILSDWFHEDYESIVARVGLATPNIPAGSPPTGFRPYSDATLVAGKGFYPCENVTSSSSCDNVGGPDDGTSGNCTEAPSCSLASLSEFRFTSGRKHLLRLVNTGAELFTLFSIDNHTLTVIANDFTPIVPYITDFVTLSVGQRTDVIVEAIGDPSEAYWMRSTANQICSTTNNPDGRAIVYYENADTTAVPSSTGYALPPSPDNNGCTNDDLALTVPSCAVAVEDPGTTFTLNLSAANNGSGVLQWLMNDVAFYGDYNAPVLLEAAAGHDTFEPAWNVFNQGNASSVRMIVYNQFLAPHPMHLHGHDFQVLATGTGIWDGTITNPSNPQRRDVQQIADKGTVANPTYIVLQWNQDNPGVWPFHCHIAWHLSAGMYINILERPDEIPRLDIPQEYFDTCTAWNAWEQSHVVDQVDSGV